MYHCTIEFSYQNFETDPVSLIETILNCWRENGQLIGREFAVTYYQEDEQIGFRAFASIPEQESLLPKWNNDEVKAALSLAENAGVRFLGYQINGRDYAAEQTNESKEMDFLILYTTHLHSCSPIFSGFTFQPIPLYQLWQNDPDLSREILHWQEDWQACDQLQMNGGCLEQAAILQISDVQSELSQRGLALCRKIEQKTGIATYYYLYRLGKDKQAEYERKCPLTGNDWLLKEPLHNIFYFKSDSARLLSNLSWEIME